MSNVRKLDPYADAKRMHPSSLPALGDPALGDAEHDGRGAVVLAFPMRATAEPAAVAQV